VITAPFTGGTRGEAGDALRMALRRKMGFPIWPAKLIAPGNRSVAMASILVGPIDRFIVW
jgi:hypothetical protein